MFSKGNKPSGSEQTRSGGASGDSEAAKVAAVPSIISADLKITGNLESSGDIQVDGMVQGDITSRTLTIGEAARRLGTSQRREGGAGLCLRGARASSKATTSGSGGPLLSHR